MKIKELFDFEDVAQVIEIGKIPDPNEIVDKFVISPNLENDLLEFLEYLKGNKPENNISINVIGNYGTGKSHLLAFISLILSKPELVNHIQNERLREGFNSLTRDFLVVKYELPAVQKKSLASIFFYRVKKQLKENYGIDIRSMDVETDEKDTKELVEEIMAKIKEKYPTSGLIVIFDEYSDFIKSKLSADQNHDLQFTRQLAESSKTQDFILMISMQEHIFSNPEFRDKAELISKIEKRFLKINITSENVEDIIAKRMVSKNQNQVQELKKLFSTINNRFSNIALEEDRYIELFPVHPYVIDVFSKLTFFENRSILQFVSQAIRKIMDNEFPAFVTFDMIYDLMIESDFGVRNNPDVKPVDGAVSSLKGIVNRIDSKYKDGGLRLIKSLAILNLTSSGDKKLGDTPDKLAENLFIIPKSQIIEPGHEVNTILKKIREKSEGQFIVRDEKKDVYYLDLKKIVDYNQLINDKAESMDDLPFVNSKFVESFLLDELDVETIKNISYLDSSKKYLLNDSFEWKERNSFRKGKLAIEIGYKVKINSDEDFLSVILGFRANNIENQHPNQITIKPGYNDDLVWSMKRLAAAEEFIRTRRHLQEMQSQKRLIIDEELKNGFKKAINNSKVVYKGKSYSLEEIGVNSDINAEIFTQIKSNLLGEDLAQEYTEYPRFKSKISYENIEGTFDSVLRDISIREGVVKDLQNQSTNILIPLGLYRDGMLDSTQSSYAKIILEQADGAMNYPIEDLTEQLKIKPYGLQKEIVYLIIAVLLRNGDIMLSSKSGKTYTSSEFSALFRSGLSAFDELKYIKKEGVLRPETKILFDNLDLNRGLLQFQKDYPVAYRSYMDRIEKIESDLGKLRNDFNRIQDSNIGLPLEDIKKEIEKIESVNFTSLKINNIYELNKIDYSPERLDEIKKGYELVETLKNLFLDIFSFILDGMQYMKNVDGWIDSEFFKETDKEELVKIYDDSKAIISNTRKLLKEDERKPIKGKIDLFKEKYKQIYYQTHKEFVGEGVEWILLDDLEQSLAYQKLKVLKDVNLVNPFSFQSLQLKIKELKDIRCLDFRVDELDTSYHCTHCMFPKGNYDPNINQTIEKMDKDVNDLLGSWEKQILDEIIDNQNKLDQLDPEEQALIDDIITSDKIPDNINFTTVMAINDLIIEFPIENIDLDDLFQRLTSGKDSLKPNEFIEIVRSYVDDITKGHERDNVRFRVVKKFE